LPTGSHLADPLLLLFTTKYTADKQAKHGK